MLVFEAQLLKLWRQAGILPSRTRVETIWFGVIRATYATEVELHSQESSYLLPVIYGSQVPVTDGQ